jgi:FkbM family methyltransferase
MKSLREFIYLAKNVNFFSAVYYLYYKVALKIHNFSWNQSYRKSKKEWVDNIYSHLQVLNNDVEIINGKELIALSIPENPTNRIYLRPFSSDFMVYNQVLIQKNYLPVITIYNQIFKTKPVNFIDLGANIGLASIFFANHYSDLNIIAIEPFKENVEMAEINMKANKLKDYKIIHGGVWNSNIRLSLNRNFRDGKEWGISLIENSAGEIEGFLLEQLLKDLILPIDFLKIDIEGAEARLFEDYHYAAGFLKKVKCLAMEIHDEFNCRNTIYARLKENDFIYYDILDLTIAVNRKYI